MNATMQPLPVAVYSTKQVREFDRKAIEEFGIPGFELMTRAGEAAMTLLGRQWPEAQTMLVVCGAGNNAGDGYVVARLAAAAGMAVRIITLVEPATLKGDAARAWNEAVAAGLAIESVADTRLTIAADVDVVIDAILGTGLARDVDGRFRAAIDAINEARRPVLALDCPSGLDSDTGLICGAAVRASATITFVGLKQGLFLGDAPACTGRLSCAHLGVPAAVCEAAAPVFERLDESVLGQILEPRPGNAHKGMNGCVLLVGGAPGMAGAIRLAAEAALRAGAGLVHVGTHPDNVEVVMAGRPEIMCRGIDSADEVADWLATTDALVLGPGLGRASWGERLFDGLIDAPVSLVVDADGLYWLAGRAASRTDWLLTPHPGEAARLLGIGTADVQRDRLGALKTLASRFGARIVLKGACSMVAELYENNEFSCFVCDYGNPGMATAGTGDVLAGIAGALAAQSRGLDRVASTAVLVHALAGDDAAAAGQRGLVAGDLMPFIRKRVNPE